MKILYFNLGKYSILNREGGFADAASFDEDGYVLKIIAGRRKSVKKRVRQSLKDLKNNKK